MQAKLLARLKELASQGVRKLGVYYPACLQIVRMRSRGTHLYTFEVAPGRRQVPERRFGEHEQSEHRARHRGKRGMGGRPRGA